MAVLPVPRPPMTRTRNSPAGFCSCSRRRAASSAWRRLFSSSSAVVLSCQRNIALRYLASSGVQTSELTILDRVLIALCLLQVTNLCDRSRLVLKLGQSLVVVSLKHSLILKQRQNSLFEREREKEERTEFRSILQYRLAVSGRAARWDETKKPALTRAAIAPR